MTLHNQPTLDPSTKAIRRAVNLDAEASVLGGIFLRNEVLLALGDLEVDDFYSPKHQAVFQAMRNIEALSEGSKLAIDPVLVDSELDRVGKSEAVGGLGFLSELTLRVPSAENVEHYAKIIKDHRVTRDVIKAHAYAIGCLAEDGDDGYAGEDAVNFGVEALQRIKVANTERGKPMGTIISAQYGRILVDLQARADGKVIHPGMPTGIGPIDRRTGGVPFDVLSMVGARPAGGKTTFASMLVDGALEFGEDDPLYFSYEDGEMSFAARRFARASGVPTQDIIARNLDAGAFAKIREAYNRISSSPDTLVMAAGMRVGDVVRYIRAHRRRRTGKLGLNRTRARLVVVDYLQKMALDDEYRGRRHEALGHITRSLSWLAQEESIAVVLLSQLKRDVENRDDPTPLMSDFKDSGDIEQDAKMMIGLHYPHHYDRDKDPNTLEVHVIKNNNGETAVVSVHWDLQTHTLCEHAISLADTRGRGRRSWEAGPPPDLFPPPPHTDEDRRR